MMNELDNDSYEMETSKEDSINSHKTAPKRPQVYSTFLQDSNQSKSKPKSAFSSNKTYIKYPPKKADDNLLKKKAKYTEVNNFTTISPVMEHENHVSNSIQLNDEQEMELANEVIGINSFESENMMIINDEYLLVSLDNQTKSNQFCFKGKCSVSLVYGHIGIAGYNLKRKLSDRPTSTKWFDLFSPETNSFISINNKLENTSPNEEINLPATKLAEVLVNLIKNSLNTKLETSAVGPKLNSFLSKSSPNSTSLFLVRSLNSHMCNYMGYIDNFKQVYQMKCADVKVMGETDRTCAQLGLFPISMQSYKSVHQESNEERIICEEIQGYEMADNRKFKLLNAGNQNSQSVMVCGGKDVGKSTFLRYMVNSFLNKYKTVAYLDCDPGQCEYTLGGCISLTFVSEPLFGPPHSHINHNTSTKSCYYYGHLSPSDTPSHYLQCIKKCHEDYIHYLSKLGREEVVPLVINTMGWNQGLGLCLLKDIVIQFKPTHIIQINHSVEANKNMPVLDRSWLETQEAASHENKFRNLKKNSPKKNNSEFSMQMNDDEDSFVSSKSSFTDDYYPDINYKLLTLKSNVPHKTQSNQIQQKRYSAKDHRNIGIIAYFAPLHDPRAYFQSIHNLRPYKVAWSKFGLHCTHANVEYNQLLRVFNASLVGLCVVDEKHIKRNSELPGVLKTFDHETRRPVVYNCNGFGVIRGINMETKEFYILTPERPQDLENVNLLVKGMLNLPHEFFYEQDIETSSPYMILSDNLQHQKENLIGNAPVQRKYLIHQQGNNQNK